MNTSPLSPTFHSARCIDPEDPQRAPVERFVREVYRERYGARIDVLYPQLLAFCDEQARLRAAVGLRCAQQGALFVERYLGEAVESTLTRALDLPVTRASVVEFGNFAASDAGDSRTLILSLIPLLRDAGKRWVLFVATRQLRNAFSRLGLGVRELCPASATALGDEAACWGSYYQADPMLCVGDLSSVASTRWAGSPATRPMPPASLPCLALDSPLALDTP